MSNIHWEDNKREATRKHFVCIMLICIPYFIYIYTIISKSSSPKILNDKILVSKTLYIGTFVDFDNDDYFELKTDNATIYRIIERNDGCIIYANHIFDDNIINEKLQKSFAVGPKCNESVGTTMWHYKNNNIIEAQSLLFTYDKNIMKTKNNYIYRQTQRIIYLYNKINYQLVGFSIKLLPTDKIQNIGYISKNNLAYIITQDKDILFINYSKFYKPKNINENLVCLR